MAQRYTGPKFQHPSSGPEGRPSPLAEIERRWLAPPAEEFLAIVPCETFPTGVLPKPMEGIRGVCRSQPTALLPARQTEKTVTSLRRCAGVISMPGGVDLAYKLQPERLSFAPPALGTPSEHGPAPRPSWRRRQGQGAQLLPSMSPCSNQLLGQVTGPYHNTAPVQHETSGCPRKHCVWPGGRGPWRNAWPAHRQNAERFLGRA